MFALVRKGCDYITTTARMPTVYCGLGLLPVTFAVLSSVSIITTYLLAVTNNHVNPLFPTISETGEQEPERNFFSLLLSLSSFIGFIIIVVRYKQFNFVSEYNELEQRILTRVNKAALILGMITCAGGAIVATFQADRGTSLRGHLTGASCTFGGGITYMWLNTYLTMKMIACGINSKGLFAFRFIVSFLSLVAFSVCVATRYVSIDQWNDDKHRTGTKEFWHPEDGGYTMHLISSFSEWITALTLLLYFLSFRKEFDQVSFEFRIKRTNYLALPFEISSEGRNTPLLA